MSLTITQSSNAALQRTKKLTCDELLPFCSEGSRGRLNRSQLRHRPSRGRDMKSVAELGPDLSSHEAKAASRVSPFRCPSDFHLP